MCLIFLCLHHAVHARQAGRGVMFSGCPSVRPSICLFVCYQTCEHDILKMNRPLLMQIGSRSRGMKRSALGSGGQRSRSHEAKAGHKNPFRRDFSRTVRRILTKPGRHIITINVHCVTSHNDWEAKGQRSRSQRTKRLGGLAEASRSARVEWLNFLVGGSVDFCLHLSMCIAVQLFPRLGPLPYGRGQ